MKQAFKPVRQMKTQRAHRQNIGSANVPVPKSMDHHAVHVLAAFGIQALEKFGLYFPVREVKQVVDDEKENDDARHHHRARSVGGLNHALAGVAHGPGAAVLDGKAHGGKNMNQEGGQKKGARGPQKGRHFFQMPGVAVERVPAEKDLQIAHEVRDHETEKKNPGHRHDVFPADRGLKKFYQRDTPVKFSLNLSKLAGEYKANRIARTSFLRRPKKKVATRPYPCKSFVGLLITLTNSIENDTM